jgi:DNA modification methylase
MYNINEIRDTIICGNTLDVLKQFPNECIDTVCCSPPYWGLRAYSTNGQVWGGSSECNHEWISNTQSKEVFDKSGSVWLTGHWKDTAEVITRKEHPEYWTNIKVETGYCQLCNAWRGELGLEPTFQLYIEHLQTIFDEVRRVLKRSGTLWCNMGDTYASKPLGTSSNSGFKNVGGWRASDAAREAIAASGAIDKTTQGVPTKSLCNIPHRFAISMTDNGWIERNCIIWHKPSCMPSSAKDRFTVDYEFVFMFSKNRKYYFEQQLEPYADITLLQKGQDYRGKDTKNYEGVVPNNTPYHPGDIKRRVIKSLDENKGRNKRTVWRINPQSFKDAHFAVFPEKLVEPMIMAGCPSVVCDTCNKPWESDLDISYTPCNTRGRANSNVANKHKQLTDSKVLQSGYRKDMLRKDKHTKVLGITPRCDCDAPTHAGIVLDPFSGSGTTCVVARKLGRHYIGIDLQPDYVKMSEKRLAEML